MKNAFSAVSTCKLKCLSKKPGLQPGLVTCACNSNLQEVETEQLRGIQGQAQLSESLSADRLDR